jgi:hypothetical protein
MRNIIGLLTFILTFLILSGCQTKPTEISGETIVKTFYTEYMTEVSSSNLIEEENSIKQKYCTKDLLDKIKKQFSEGELDYDPFLNAQDANVNNIPSLTVLRDPKIKDKYIVSYIDNYSKNRITINLLLNDSLKIKSVW